jgi:hypothetical protein
MWSFCIGTYCGRTSWSARACDQTCWFGRRADICVGTFVRGLKSSSPFDFIWITSFSLLLTISYSTYRRFFRDSYVFFLFRSVSFVTRPSDLAARTPTQNVQRDDDPESFLRRGGAKELWIGPQREDGRRRLTLVSASCSATISSDGMQRFIFRLDLSRTITIIFFSFFFFVSFRLTLCVSNVLI